MEKNFIEKATVEDGHWKINVYITGIYADKRKH